MFIIPAVDIKDGRCVRLVQGNASRQLVYADDPVDVARRWAERGARWLHIVDLDGAFSGRPVHLALIRAISAVAQVPVQLGGGMRTLDDVARAFDAGASRVILGTAAVNLAPQAVRRFGDRIAVSLDVKHGLLTVEGWKASAGDDPITVGRTLAGSGVGRFIYTDVLRDGMLSGPNVEAVRRFVQAVDVPVMAAGGIASDADLDELSRAGVEAAVVGRALYEGWIDLRAASARWEQVRAD